MDSRNTSNPFYTDQPPIQQQLSYQPPKPKTQWTYQSSTTVPINSNNIGSTENIVLDETDSAANASAYPPPTSGHKQSLWDEIMTNHDLLMSKFFYFFSFAAFGSLFPLMGIYFKQMGMNSIQAGILTGVRPFIEIISAPFWGSLADRFHKGKILILSSMISWVIFTSALSYIRTPVEGCVIFNDTHHIFFHPYLEENDEGYEIMISKARTRRTTYDYLLKSTEELSTPLSKQNADHLHQRSKRDTHYRLPPTHITGKSPITIEYTLNYNKEAHSSYVSPPFSTLVYKWEDVESVFFLLWLLILLGEFFSAPAITLADSVTLGHLGDDTGNYSRQRMFGSVGWAISMFFVGIALDNSKEFVNHPCGPHESERNYVVCFKIFDVLMILAIGFAFKFRFTYAVEPLQDADMPMKAYMDAGPRSIFNTAPPINPPPELLSKEKKFEFLEKWKSAVFAQRTRELPEWMEVFRHFNTSRYQAFLFITWFMGVGIGLVFTFLFWHLQDLGGTPTLFGIASVINHISEIAAYFYSLDFIKKYGHNRVLCFGLCCNIFRFLYIAWLDNSWWVLPIEFVQGITHATVWAVCCSYITQATPPHLKASTQGVLQGLYHGLGKGCGAILGGILINQFGTPFVFALYAIMSALILGFFMWINSKRTGTGFSWLEDEANRQVCIDEGPGIAPHGCPSAPIARTTSKCNLNSVHDERTGASSDLYLRTSEPDFGRSQAANIAGGDSKFAYN